MAASYWQLWWLKTWEIWGQWFGWKTIVLPVLLAAIGLYLHWFIDVRIDWFDELAGTVGGEAMITLIYVVLPLAVASVVLWIAAAVQAPKQVHADTTKRIKELEAAIEAAKVEAEKLKAAADKREDKLKKLADIKSAIRGWAARVPLLAEYTPERGVAWQHGAENMLGRSVHYSGRRFSGRSDTYEGMLAAAGDLTGCAEALSLSDIPD